MYRVKISSNISKRQFHTSTVNTVRYGERGTMKVSDYDSPIPNLEKSLKPGLEKEWLKEIKFSIECPEFTPNNQNPTE